MKKIFSFVLIAFVAAAGYGQVPVFQWGAAVKSNDPTGPTTAYDVKTNSNGDVFVFGTFNSHADKPYKKIAYRHYNSSGELTVKESPNGALTTTAVSGNPNLFLYKMNQAGEILWQVTSDRGRIDGHYSQFTPTADGGVFMVLCTGFAGNNEFEDDRLIRIVENNGDKPAAGSVKRSPYENNTDQGVAVKIDANGHVEWSRLLIRVDDAKIGDKLANTAIYFNDLVTDADGNYWLAGRYLKEITLDKPDGTSQTFTPHNVAGWNGDAQLSRGDALLLQLDPNGKLLRKIETTGTVDYQSVNSLHYHNNSLFLYGNIAATPGDDTSSSTLLGHTLYPSDKINAYSARIDLSNPQPEARWVTLLKSLPQTNAKGGRIKVTNLCYDNGALFLCGSLTGFVAVNGDTILSNDIASGTSTSLLMGFVVRQDPATGEIVNAFLDPAVGMAAEIENAAFRQNKIYAFGYALGGTWLHVYDPDFNSLGGYNFLSAEGATAWDAVFLDDRLITVNRGRNVGAITGAPAPFVSENPPTYSAFLLSYGLDELQQTAIRRPSQPDNALSLLTRPSALRITGNARVKIVAISGVTVYDGIVNGEKEIPLAPGLYIVAANGNARKIGVRN